MARFYFLISAGLLLFSCAGTQLKLQPWQKLPKAEYTIPPYAKHLANYKIALDPGHGGNAHLPGYKRGPTGKREAVMNLNVAFALKEFLEKAGAEVFMTRLDDQYVALADRAAMAAEAGCHFMLSLHHNASENPETNYTAVFYHLTPDQSPVSMDLARHIYFGLVNALRLPQVLDDGLLTDRLYYPAGYGVLRRSSMPAILLESSFFSSPREEKRLMDLKYNRREAYGIFLGLARWAAGGLPSVTLQSPDGISTSKTPEIVYQIYDGVSERGARESKEGLIFSESVIAKIDSKQVSVQLSADKRKIVFQPAEPLTNGNHVVQVRLQNMFKHHNFPRSDTLIISAPADSIHFDYPTQYLPATETVTMPVVLSVYDHDGEAVWDSTQVKVAVNKGHIAPVTPQLKQGRARVYYQPDSEMGLVYLTAATPDFSDTLLLSLTPAGQTWTLSGAVIDDSTGTAIENAAVGLNDSTQTTTDHHGVYFFLNPPVGQSSIEVHKDGYEVIHRQVNIDSSRSLRENFGLWPNLGGILHNQVIILDAALGDTATGDFFGDSTKAATANLALANQLSARLRWAGANPLLVRADDRWLPSKKRIQIVNAIPEGWYLKVAYEKWDSDSVFIQTTIYPANKVGEQIATAVVAAFSELPLVAGGVLQNTKVPEVTLTNKTAIEVRIRCREAKIVERDLPALFSAIVKFYRLEKDT